MTKKEAEILIQQYNEGNCSPEEAQLVEKYFLTYLAHSKEIPDWLRMEADQVEMYETVQAHLLKTADTNKVKKLWLRISAAASILIFLSVGGYFLVQQQTSQQIAQNDILAGGNKAILTLPNGKRIILTNAQNGQLVQVGNTAIHKTADGEVTYRDFGTGKDGEIRFDTLSVPRGGQYQLNLSDGTKVWLNAATTIRYPEKFVGNERMVELISGEAYFKVVHNAKMPFNVKSKGQVIRDLGTEFNVNAYPDEAVATTTLLEGSIKISKNGQSAILKPGQQAVVQPSSDAIKVSEVDTEEAAAWKNGYFMFNNESLVSVMRKISRWYDVEIQYPSGQNVTEKYLGNLPRQMSVAKVLHYLEVTGDVKFKIEGKKIIVLKKNNL